MRLDERGTEFQIDPIPIWPADDARLEPVFMAGPLWIEFDEPGRAEPAPPQTTAGGWPLLVEFDEFALASELAAEQVPAETAAVATSSPSRSGLAAPIASSVAVHLLPLLVLIAAANWHRDHSGDAAERAAISVRLQLETPPAPAALAASNLPPGELVPQSAEALPSQAATTKTAAAALRKPVPEKKPHPSAAAAAAASRRRSPPPVPPEPGSYRSAVAEKLPSVPAPAPEMPVASGPSPAPTAPAVQTTGTDPSRADYFAELRALTRQHLDLLPVSFIAGRRGETILRILVLRDGTIARIAVSHSSGYRDIDARIEQIVTAVGRFPSLPAAFPGANAELELKLNFPQALQE